MSIQRPFAAATAASVAVALCLFGAEPLQAKDKKESGGAQLIDFEKLAKVIKTKGKEQVLDAAELPPIPSSLPGYANPPGIWLPGKRDLVQQVLKCSDTRCALRVMRMVKSGEQVNQEAQVDLPPLPSGVTELEYLPLSVLDIDGDHKDELLVRYRFQKKLGSRAGEATTEMLAVISYPEMSLALLHDLRQAGREGPEAECKYDVARRDVNGDRRIDLQFVHSCQCAAGVDDCHKGPDSPEEYAVGADRRFVRYFPPK